MKAKHTNTIWSLSLAVIVISGVELILAVLLAVSLSVGTRAVLSSDALQNFAVKISQIIENASIEVGSIDVVMQSQDGATVNYSNIPNIDLKTLQDAGIIDSNGKVVGTTIQKITVAMLSILITSFILAVIEAFFTFLIGFLIHLRSGKPQKYGSVLAWSLICAVLTFVSCRWVLTVLFIIIAVSAGSSKTAPGPRKAAVEPRPQLAAEAVEA